MSSSYTATPTLGFNDHLSTKFQSAAKRKSPVARELRKALEPEGGKTRTIAPIDGWVDPTALTILYFRPIEDGANPLLSVSTRAGSCWRCRVNVLPSTRNSQFLLNPYRSSLGIKVVCSRSSPLLRYSRWIAVSN